jgi:hypothetical protein
MNPACCAELVDATLNGALEQVGGCTAVWAASGEAASKFAANKPAQERTVAASQFADALRFIFVSYWANLASRSRIDNRRSVSGFPQTLRRAANLLGHHRLLTAATLPVLSSPPVART